MINKRRPPILPRDCRDLVSAWHHLVTSEGPTPANPHPLHRAMGALAEKSGSIVTSGRISEWRRGIQRPNLRVVREMLCIVLPAALEVEGVDIRAFTPAVIARLADRLTPPQSVRPKAAKPTRR